MRHGGTGLKFSIIIDCKSSKLSSYSLLKDMSKRPISDLNKRGLFFKFCLIFKGPPFKYYKVWDPNIQ